MKKALLLAAVLSVAAASPAAADQETRNRLIRFFGGWYSWFPNTRLVVKETREVEIPGFEAYRVGRKTESKAHQESNIVLFDKAKDDIFVGQVFHDDARRFAKRPFDAAGDLPKIENSLASALGMPVKVTLDERPRGSLKPISLAIRYGENAAVSVGGFVSEDGSSLLLGEFHPLASEAQAVRRRMIEESRGIRTSTGKFYVTEFLDFQCARCRVRAPEVKRAVTELGGAVELRLFPLVRTHEWSLPAAESAAALANVDPSLYSKFEEAVFARADSLNAQAVRDLARDVAEAAGVKAAFEGELSSGRARDRVLGDIRLGIRLGMTGTPSFFHDGNFVSGERELFETYLRGKVSPPARATGT